MNELAIKNLRLAPDLGFVAPEPEKLGAYGLGREQRSATIEERLLPIALVELPYLFLRPGVYAVEDRRPQGFPVLVRRQEGRPDAAGADRGDAVVGFVEKLLAHGDEVRPPHLLGVVLGPSGAGERKPVFSLGGGDDLAGGSGEHALGARGADVHAEQEPAHAAPPNPADLKGIPARQEAAPALTSIIVNYLAQVAVWTGRSHESSPPPRQSHRL